MLILCCYTPRSRYRATSFMEKIQSDIERHLRRGLLGRFFRHSSISALLDGHMDTLERARESFNVSHYHEEWVMILITVPLLGNCYDFDASETRTICKRKS